MQKVALVSFIIPYHNEPEYMLAECLQSIARLSLKEQEREVIVVDDGSETDRVALARSIFPNVVYIKQDCAGLSVARNTGIEAARGEYIQFVDGDDCLLTKGYEKVLNIIRTRRPQMVKFYHSKRLRPRRVKWAFMLHTSGVDFLRNHNLCGAVWDCVTRRETIGSLRFHPGLIHEDELFTPLLILKVERLTVTHVPAYYYRQRPGSLTHSTTLEEVDRRMEHVHFIIRQLQAHSQTLAPIPREALERRVHQLTMVLVYNTYRLTRPYLSLKQVRTRLQPLKKEGLLPLPMRNYNAKYVFFSLLTRLI